MRIWFSLGGGPHRGRGPRHRHHRRSGIGISVGIPIGPVGSIIVWFMLIVAGVFVILTSFRNVMPLIIGVSLLILGIFGVRGSIRKIKHNKYKNDNFDEE